MAIIATHLHAIRSWRQPHDNGWMAHVVEQADGTFVAWASPAGATPICIDYIEDSLQFAQEAALFALRRDTAHPRCSDRCGCWNEGA